MYESIPGQKKRCFISEVIRSLPWCPRSSWRAWNTISSYPGRRTSWRNSCPFSVDLQWKIPPDKQSLSQSLKYLVSINGSTSFLAGAFKPCSSLSMIYFKVGVSCCALLQSFDVNPYACSCWSEFLAEAMVGLMPESLRVPRSPLMDNFHLQQKRTKPL